ncbi:MAG TPA: S9 family peptidase [Candidatus Baltobacteraceae bacterium]|nr:S9 family peptidase [Candidatus Baltobacteraceae bacterium]
MFTAAVPTVAKARSLTVADMRHLVDFTEPAISLDASRIAVVLLRAERPSLLIVDARTGAQRTVATGGSVAVPRWSPNGSSLAYLREDRSGIEQIYVLGGSSTPVQLTHSATGITDFAWRPDGKALAYVAADSTSPRAFFYAGDNDYTAASLTPPAHLWVISASGGAATRLTSGSWTIAQADVGGTFQSQMSWSRDGRRIAFTRVANTFSGDSERSTIWEVDLAAHHVQKLTEHKDLELTPSFSPDGKTLTYWYARRGNFLAENTIRARANGQDIDLTRAFDRNTGASLWFPDGRSMLTCAADRTRIFAYVLSLNRSIRRLNLGSLNPVCETYQSSTFDSGIEASIARSGAVAFIAGSAYSAHELYLMPAAGGAVRQLTHFNDFVHTLDLGRVEEIASHGPGGFTEYGVLTFPPHMQAHRKYPIVVNIHGGPGLASLQDFAYSTWPRAQLIAARGYIVYEPNYRGSDNIGNRFLLALAGDTVRGPAADIMSGLAEVKKLPQADPSRIGVCGWSYGGLMTSWLITQYHFWRAAVSGAAVDDETEEYATSTSNVQNTYYLGISPFAPGGDRVYREQSPITYASAVTTPTLFWGTTLDPVVPIPQQYAFYHAVKEHHVTTRFAVFPASTHGPATERQTEALTTIWLDWFDRYMK